MSISATSGSVKASDVIVAIKDRLVELLLNVDDQPIDETFVRIVAHPGPDYANYRAERGVAICFQSPEPFTQAGAGRYGLITTRTMEVHLATQSHLDPAENDQIAVVAHLDMEESVVNALHDAAPQTTPVHIGVSVRWIPGGAEIARNVKRDQGMLLSVLLFEVKYVPPLLVTLA